MQPIETGYKPEWGLGAWFAGENAANQSALAQEELIRNYLANQRERTMQPLDTSIKQTEVARAEAGRSPEMIDAYKQGYIGQNQSQEVAGRMAKALEPFKTTAQQRGLENEAETQGTLFTIKDIDSKLQQGGTVDPQTGVLAAFSPQQKAFMQQKRNELVEGLKSTPEFAQKKELSDDKLAMQLQLAELRAQYQKSIQDAKALATKPENESQLIAWAHRTAADPNASPEQQAQAKQIIDAIAMRKLMAAPQGWATGLDVPQISGQPAMPTPVQKAQAAVGQQPTTQLSEQDQQALAWANSNPKDPRSIAIKKKLGVQ